MPRLHERLLMLCGSVNPITLTQLERAEQAGFLRLRMRPDQKLEPEYWETPAGQEQLECWIDQLEQGGHAVIDSNDPGGNEPTARYAREQGLTLEEVRQRISGSLGQILKAVHDHGVEGTLLITGRRHPEAVHGPAGSVPDRAAVRAGTRRGAVPFHLSGCNPLCDFQVRGIRK